MSLPWPLNQPGRIVTRGCRLENILVHPRNFKRFSPIRVHRKKFNFRKFQKISENSQKICTLGRRVDNPSYCEEESSLVTDGCGVSSTGLAFEQIVLGKFDVRLYTKYIKHKCIFRHTIRTIVIETIV